MGKPSHRTGSQLLANGGASVQSLAVRVQGHVLKAVSITLTGFHELLPFIVHIYTYFVFSPQSVSLFQWHNCQRYSSKDSYIQTESYHQGGDAGPQRLHGG